MVKKHLDMMCVSCYSEMRKGEKMIKSYLTNKKVSWNELIRINNTDKPDYQRKEMFGKVLDVSSCNGLAYIMGDDGRYHEIETAELEIID